jgi:hypothetical protein
MPAEPSASSEPISGARSDAHNLAETNVDVRVDTVKSGMSTNAGQPAGSVNRDLPGWCGVCWLFYHGGSFCGTSPACDWGKQEGPSESEL